MAIFIVRYTDAIQIPLITYACEIFAINHILPALFCKYLTDRLRDLLEFQQITIQMDALFIVQRKAPSFDFACSGSEHQGLQGYDLGTRLDSTLDFTAQWASLSGTDGIRITGQSFGFDLAAEVTEVALDPKQGHYYLEIAPASQEN